MDGYDSRLERRAHEMAETEEEAMGLLRLWAEAPYHRPLVAGGDWEWLEDDEEEVGGDPWRE